MTMTVEQTAQYIAALVQERGMAIARADAGRVSDIDAELHRIGAAAQTPATRAAKRPRKTAEER
tara:strand:- start:642 stop:833 length:192 start_codon:yes stop_codon:yes gene_type:complete